MGDFKFRRVTCRGDDYSEVEIVLESSNGDFGFSTNVPPSYFPDDQYLPCIKEGILSAFEIASENSARYKVTLNSASNVTGEASPAGFKACATGAVLKALGKANLGPNPGLVK